MYRPTFPQAGGGGGGEPRRSLQQQRQIRKKATVQNNIRRYFQGHLQLKDFVPLTGQKHPSQQILRGIVQYFKQTDSIPLTPQAVRQYLVRKKRQYTQRKAATAQTQQYHIDPITSIQMRDPVRASDGHIYDRSTVLRAMQSNTRLVGGTIITGYNQLSAQQKQKIQKSKQKRI
jgi:hypothetical protein